MQVEPVWAVWRNRCSEPVFYSGLRLYSAYGNGVVDRMEAWADSFLAGVIYVMDVTDATDREAGVCTEDEFTRCNEPELLGYARA